MKDEPKDECLHELERINKEIETVRHEVEQEQRRLSSYQTERTDVRSDAPVSKCETSVLPPSKGRKANVQARKYVVDNSKPRTDLEYDPMSNFSAALHSYSSPGKEHKGKNREAKRSSSAHFDQKKPSAPQASRSPSPDPLNESTKGCVLVIDISLSPQKTSGPSQKPAAVKSFQVQKREAEEVKTETSSLNSQPLNEVVSVAVSPSLKDNINEVYGRCLVENKQDSPTCDDGKDSEVDLNGYLKAFEIECDNTRFHLAETGEKISKQRHFPIKSNQQGHNSPLESASSVEKINPLQPPNNPHLYKPLAANCPPVKRPTKQYDTVEQPAPDEVQSCSESSAVQQSQKMLSKTQGKVLKKSTVNQEQAETPQVSFLSVSSSENSYSRAESSKSTEPFLEAESESVIIIDSSCDEEEEENGEELGCAEMELSDSDPMEECYRIFMEANSEENRNKEHPGVSVSALWIQFAQP